jgi:hypothetical protein
MIFVFSDFLMGFCFRLVVVDLVLVILLELVRNGWFGLVSQILV